MKKVFKSIIASALALGCIASFAGCTNNGGMITTEPNVGVEQGTAESVGKYSSVAYYELERPDDVKIKFETDDIQKVSFKYRVLDSKEYYLKNDTLTIKKSVFENETAGDKRLRVFVGDKYTEITLRVVSKVIYTTDDFNSIRANLNGVFVLGADIDFGDQEFWPIGKAVEPSSVETDSDGKKVYHYSDSTFEGIFDGMGYSVKNITINAYDHSVNENKYVDWVRVDADDNEDLGNGFYSQEWYGHHFKAVRDPETFDKSFLAENEILVKQDQFTFVATVEFQGPSLGNKEENGHNYNNGIFMSTGGSAQIINTNFVNITVNCQGLGGSVVGANGGLVKNCSVTCTLNTHGTYSERAGGIVGTNGSGDAAGRIENCIVFYSWTGNVPARGIADWNNGVIKNSYAALKDDYVYHMAYDSETKSVPEDFDYDEFITQDNFTDYGLGWYTTPSFPGAMGWADGVLNYYKAGDIINSDVVRKEYLLNPDNFTEENGWDADIWNFTYGAYPTIKVQQR